MREQTIHEQQITKSLSVKNLLPETKGYYTAIYWTIYHSMSKSNGFNDIILSKEMNTIAPISTLLNNYVLSVILNSTDKVWTLNREVSFV